MNIWQYQRKLSNRLLAWSALSVLFGTGMRLDRYDPLKSAGAQFLAWGAIDGLIAVLGKRVARRRSAELEDPLSAEIVQAEARKLSRILWLNTGLDVLYMLGGYALTQRKTGDQQAQQGHGVGIIIQGAFLFIFDLLHALFVPKARI